MTKERATDQHAEANPARFGGKERDRRDPLEHPRIGPAVDLAELLAELEEVIHHPQTCESRVVGGGRDPAERFAETRRTAGKIEPTDV
jgi:hypothetical protein